MAIKITKSDIKWSYLSLILFNGINLILLPFILAYLNEFEVGLWYTFTAVSGLVVLLDFGFMTTLSRNVTFIWAGAKEIKSSGFVKSTEDSTPNLNLFVKLFKTTKLIYLVLGLVIYIILLSIGSYYIYVVSHNDLLVGSVMLSWVIYSTAVFLNMRYAYWNAILKGIGAIKQNQQLLIVTKLTQLLFTVIGLLLGYGLIAVALAYLLSIIVNRILANYIFYAYQNNKQNLKPLLKLRINKKEYRSILANILPNTYKQGLISVSNYINLRSTTLLSSAFLGLQLTASLGFVLQVISLITVVANTFFNTYLPQFSSYRLKGEYTSLKKVFKKALLINYLIIFTSYIMFFIFVNLILDIINSNVKLLSAPLIIIIMIYMFLYNNHSVFATFISTSNVLPQYKGFIISAVLVLVTQIILLMNFQPNMWLLLLPILIIQLLYNNWKWPYESFRELSQLR